MKIPPIAKNPSARPRDIIQFPKAAVLRELRAALDKSENSEAFGKAHVVACEHSFPPGRCGPSGRRPKYCCDRARASRPPKIAPLSSAACAGYFAGRTLIVAVPPLFR